jgi:ribosomal protein S18 acetylase RimI-like enzyme
MPEIEIRPALAGDIPSLVALDHYSTTDHVWQMEFNQDRDQGQLTVGFREMRLPRSVRVEYPRSASGLTSGWARLSGMLVASLVEHPIGYAGLMLDLMPGAAWITDLVVDRELRRKGIGSGLVLASGEWAASMGCNGLIMEMQPKNYPAIRLASKLGFEFCGYNEHYYTNRDIGIFFYKPI